MSDEIEWRSRTPQSINHAWREQWTHDLVYPLCNMQQPGVGRHSLYASHGIGRKCARCRKLISKGASRD